MSDGLTAPSAPPTHEQHPELLASRHERPGRSAWVVAPIQALVIVVVFAGAGAGCGWLWFKAWRAPSGVVSGGQWYTNEAGLRGDFLGVGWFVTIALAAGLVLGILAAWLLDRAELVTLGAVLVGSLLAAYVMYQVGTRLGPADPQELAKSAKDGTKLKGALAVTSWPPRGAFTFGALIGLAIVYFVSAGRSPRPVSSDVPSELPGVYTAHPQG